MSNNCVFCRIVLGELPCASVYEDPDTLAFLDINPVVKGHALVIPKAHHDPITATPTSVLRKLIVVVREVARAQIKALGADGINVTQANGKIAGQIIEHIHFHVIPRFSNQPGPANWHPGKYDWDDERSDLAMRIRGEMGNPDGGERDA